MKVSNISLEQYCDLIEKSEIKIKVDSPASTTYYLMTDGKNVVLIHTAFENYMIGQGN